MMTQAEKTRFIGSLFSLIPYALVAWGFTQFDTSISFWIALGVLIGLRVAFTIMEAVGSVLTWRLYGRAQAINGIVRLLRENKFPLRYCRNDDFLKYLSRIEEDYHIDAELRKTARETEKMLEMYEGMGILAGARMHSASEAALENYSPRALAPVST